MKKKTKKITIVSVTALLVLVIYLVFFSGSETVINYSYGKITKGDLHVVITSTGILEATSTVDVGTQVSGKIIKLLVDFNSEVKKGQLLAIIDTVTLVAQVKEAQANLAKAKADYHQKNVLCERNKKLFEKDFISELDLLQSQTDLESSLASLKSAELTVERARTNLDYAYIYAPIAGRIINRSVEQGQTVAASFSSPTLFTIAQDLSSMRIMASVDESDIGQIKEGQKVTFTVQTYSDKTFEGTVTQIRLQSTVASNVVNYTVVINAQNGQKYLLPGMTATVDFYVDFREKVLLVPNAALRVEPSEELLAVMQNNMREEIANIPDSIKNKFKNQPPPPMPGMDGENSETKSKVSMMKIYFVDGNGKYKMCPVVTGLTDGKNTEIVMGRDLKAGMKVITGMIENTAKTKSSSIMTTGSQGGPPPMM